MISPRTAQSDKDHLQSLISQWENLLKDETLSSTKYYELYERSKTILSILCTDTRDFLNQLTPSPTTNNVERFIGKLRATLLDLGKGLLNFEYQIQDKMTIDLMQQASDLLDETNAKDHGEYISAAVLAGAVLENFLKTLCLRQSPPILPITEKGTYRTLGMIVSELEKIDFYNPIEIKQIKVWVEIRNAAAHGQFGKFDPKHVKNMIGGIREFIEKYQAKT